MTVIRRKITEILDLKNALIERSMYEPMSGCLLWIAGFDSRGYGAIRFRDKQEKAHRMSYLVFVGDLKKEVILHKCDNRACINPKHLKDATFRENTIDFYNKKYKVNLHLDNGLKEYCVNGHRITPQNVLLSKNRTKYGISYISEICRECNRIAVSKVRKRNKDKMLIPKT